MKVLAVLIMLAALFLLYRIAYPGGKAKDSDPPPEKPEPAADVMGKSRYVLPDRSKPLPVLRKMKRTKEKRLLLPPEAKKGMRLSRPENRMKFSAKSPIPNLWTSNRTKTKRSRTVKKKSSACGKRREGMRKRQKA
ncbi:MAG: hypothetical protein LBK58_04170 [Prevotellaceae bacterium]|jgi:hypothetical protein|nr:hypothetical protein [Prevotellaceae bacterium]